MADDATIKRRCTCDFRSATIAASPHSEPTRDINCAIHGDAAWEAHRRVRDIVTRLQCAYPSGEWPCEECTFCAARAEIDRLRAVLDAIDALHTAFTDEGDQFCHECVGGWPCPTHLLIHPEEARRG